MPRRTSTSLTARRPSISTAPYSPPVSPLTTPSTLRKPSNSRDRSRKLSTGVTAHDPPVDSSDNTLTTDIATKLVWKMLDHNFLSPDTSLEDVEDAGSEWVKSFGRPILGAYEVKLRDRCALLRAERNQRLEMRDESFSQASVQFFGKKGHDLPTPTSPRAASATPFFPKAKFDSDTDAELWADKEIEAEEGMSKAEREIEIARDLHEAAWRWVEAHLDHYTREWSTMGLWKGWKRTEVVIWKDCVAVRREMEGLEEEVRELRRVRGGSM